jgi:small-conductance mechanosensitive channel/CRP-like cAMP-binding protein
MTIIQELLLKLGVTFLLAIGLFGLFLYFANVRAKKISRMVAAVFVATLLLFLSLLVFASGLVPPLPRVLHNWITLFAYLGATFVVLKAADLLLIEDFLIDKKGLHIPDLIRLLIILAGLSVGVLVFLRLVVGINVIALVAIPTAATAVIGFALQDTIKRFFAGIMLGKLVRVGDWICVGGKEGWVTKVDLGHLTIMTRDDDLLMIPNNLVVQQDLLNYYKPTTTHARTVLADAGYNAPPLQVTAVLIEAAKAVSGVLADPAPQAFVAAFKDSGIQYRLRFWINDHALALDLDGQVLAYVWYAFKRNGIEIPFPQRTIHMTKPVGEDESMWREQERIRGALRRIDFLAVLSPDGLDHVAQEAKIQLYLPGETVFHQGDVGAELYCILEGSAEVRMREGTTVSTVATLGLMQFFGEMSLLTGERRSATVLAQTRLEVLMLTKQALAGPIRENPVLAEQMSAVLAQRKSDQAARLQEMAARRGETDRDREARARSLGARILKFFGVGD